MEEKNKKGNKDPKTIGSKKKLNKPKPDPSKKKYTTVDGKNIPKDTKKRMPKKTAKKPGKPVRKNVGVSAKNPISIDQPQVPGGYIMNIGSKENDSPTNFKTKDAMLMMQSPMMMHIPGDPKKGHDPKKKRPTTSLKNALASEKDYQLIPGYEERLGGELEGVTVTAKLNQSKNNKNNKNNNNSTGKTSRKNTYVLVKTKSGKLRRRGPGAVKWNKLKPGAKLRKVINRGKGGGYNTKINLKNPRGYQGGEYFSGGRVVFQKADGSGEQKVHGSRTKKNFGRGIYDFFDNLGYQLRRPTWKSKKK
jgi:hypothetical protein